MAKAAKQLALAADAPVAAPPKGPSLVMQIVMLLLMTVAALGIGWVTGGMLRGESSASTTEAAAHAPGGGHGEAAGGHGEATAEGGHGEAVGNPLLVQLEPITTNLAAPSETWIRLEATLLLDAPAEPSLVEAVHQDLLAYVRTLKMHQIEGASGFQHLKADLEERAAVRSEGHVKNVLIRTLLFE